MSMSRFVIRVVLPVALVLAGTLAFAILVFVVAVRSADEAAVASQTSLLATATRQRVAETSKDQKSVAIWDDAFNNIQKQFDQAWAHVNLGGWMFDYFGHNLTYVLDSSGRPVYASSEGSLVEPRDFRRVRDDVAPLVDEVRARSDARLTAVPAEGEDPPAFAAAARVLVVAGRPSVAAVMTIVPEDDALRAGAEPFLLVTVTYLDRAFLDALVRDYRIADARFESDPAQGPEWTSVPLLRADGTPVSHLVWRPERPGARIVDDISAGFVLVTFAILALTCAVLANLWRKSRQLVASREEARTAAARSLELANHDALTGLANRRVLLSTAQAWLSACGEGRGVALHYLDLDDFKGVNDRYGHDRGDAFLCEIADRLVRFAPPGACVARQGGDEFAMLVKDVASLEECDLLATRLAAALRVPVEIDGMLRASSSSVGTACAFDPDFEGAELVRCADVALYEAKRVPGGGRCMYDAAIDERVRHERQLRDELAVAIAEDGLSLVYQPIVDRDGQLVAVEALARWTRRDGTTVPPVEFIPVAEAHGLMGRLSDRVLAAATRDAAGWRALPVAVNVSPADLVDPQFLRRVAGALREAGLDPSRLIVEVTESALNEGSDTVAAVLRQLRQTGVTVAIDDFGMGFSNLSRLSTLPVDVVKIDRALVVAAGQGAAGPAVLEAVVSLGKAIGLKVLAEGIENPLQREAVLKSGCDLMQGFLISRPVPASEITERCVAREPVRVTPLTVVNAEPSSRPSPSSSSASA